MSIKRRVTEEDFTDNPEDEAVSVVTEGISPEEYDELISQNMSTLKVGEIVKGVVVERRPAHVVIDVGFKSEGAVSLSEFGLEADTINVGDEVEVFLEAVEDVNGMLVVSKEKANKVRIWDDMEKKFESEETIEGTITHKIKGGLSVEIGLKAFLPGSQIDLRPIKNLDRMIGETYQFRIIKMNKKRGNIVLSRRILLEQERKVSKSAALESLEEGKVVEGIVKNITDYGAFIDLGGIDGLLHITDMSWGRVNHPTDMLSIGDTTNVMVLKFDREKERVSLGLKQTTRDPWSEAEEKYQPTTRVIGKVVSIADYGAFVELEEGIEGLVHISEMTWNKNVRHPNKIVSIGDQVDAVVLAIDTEKKRISLGMKQIQDNPWDTIEERYPKGIEVEGKVRNLADFGAFVELEEGVDGLVHISDMSWTAKIKHPSEIVKKKDVVKCVVLAVDKENQRLSLGMKQLESDPWDNVETKYTVGTDLKCEITKVTNFGAFAELEGGVEGLIHVSQLSTDRVENPASAVSVGQEVTAKVINVDSENRKIGLSVKAFLEGLSPDEAAREVAEMEQSIPSEPAPVEEPAGAEETADAD